MVNRLASLSDPALGELVWHEPDLAWHGSIQVRGSSVLLSLDPGFADPSESEQRAVVEQSRGLAQRVIAAERELLRAAAAQIADDVGDQGELPVDEFLASLEPIEVSLHGSGELHYRCHGFFPNSILTIFFDEALVFGGAEIYNAEKPA